MNWIIGWLLICCGVYSFAKSKGRNQYLWFAIGLIIGPFAVLILAFLPTTEKGDKSYQ